MKKMMYSVVGSVAALAVVSMLGTAFLWPMINEVETGATPEYPEIQPHYYSTDPDRIYEEAVAAIEALDRWEIADRSPSEHRIDAERSTRIFGFVDDVVVRIEPVTEHVTQVHVRSASRVGKADFGQNARNIEEFFAELDDRLGAVLFDPDESPGESPEDVEAEDGEVGDG